MSMIADLRALGRAGSDFVNKNARYLKAEEIAEARKVFIETIDYSRVWIVDKLGYGNRPWTWVAPLDLKNCYYIFLGPTVFSGSASVNWPTFIHEMTHVWQGQNHAIDSGYMLNSAIAQMIDGKMAYDYSPGDFWGNYNVEQQAHLVEDWYSKDGMSEASMRFYYIKNCIRTPWRAWVSDMIAPSPSPPGPPQRP